MSAGSDGVFAGSQNDYYYLSSRGVNQVLFTPQTSAPLIPSGKDSLYVGTNHTLIYDGALLNIPNQGINQYLLTTSAITATLTALSFAPNVLTVGNPFNLVSGTNFTALRPGVYNLTFIFGIEEATAPATVDLEMNFIVQAFTTASGNYYWNQSLQRYVAKGSSAGSLERVITLSATGWLNTGDYVQCAAQSLGGTNATNVSSYVNTWSI
jgi:hypothetical protein